jgi:hypothetical protein
MVLFSVITIKTSFAMRNITLLAIALFACQLSIAKIWRVNNVPGVTADFTTVQSAHDAAGVQPGDTLHIEPSITTYGSLTSMSKRLVIISIGEFLSVNPGSQYAQVTGTIAAITINNVSASNSVFHCNVTGGVSISNANSLRFERCFIGSSISVNSGNNHVFTGNYIYAIIFTNSVNNIVSNNIIKYFMDVNTSASATVVNNVLFAETAATGRAMSNTTFQNNIINKNGSFSFNNSVVENNVASNTSLPAGSGNQNSVNMATVFVNPNGADDASFVLQTSGTNPAVGTGTAGVDCGAYGGNTPLKRGLQPAIPAIYKLSAPAAPTGNTMNVIFSTKSNN